MVDSLFYILFSQQTHHAVSMFIRRLIHVNTALFNGVCLLNLQNVSVLHMIYTLSLLTKALAGNNMRVDCNRVAKTLH